MSHAKSTPKDGQSGYKGEHVEGSRKGKVHALYDKEGPEAAWTLGLKLKLKQSTLRSWFGAWNKGKAKPAPSSKPKKKVINAMNAAPETQPTPAAAL
jgi:hypothetical protein